MARKRKMREELLAHLTAIFEEERQKADDEQAALDQAKQRFGNVRELSEQIQGAIPRREWFSYVTERILLFRNGESALTHSMRVAVSMFLWFATTLVLLPPVLLLRGRQHEIVRLELAFVAAAIAFAGLFFIMTLLGHGLRRALFPRTSARSLLTASLYLLSSAPVVPVFGFLLASIATGDLAVGYAHFRSLCWSIVVVPVILVAAVWQIAKDAQNDNDWACLEIGE
jgi:ATP-dependent Clp protease ATP-binding subunit ClpC